MSDELTLFGSPDEFEAWRNEWVGMPEYVCEDLAPFAQVIVSFATRADMEAFAKLIGQRVLSTTRSVWYPEAEELRSTGSGLFGLLSARAALPVAVAISAT